MSQKHRAMRILDAVFIGFTMVLVMAVAGLPVEWLFDLVRRARIDLRRRGLGVARDQVDASGIKGPPLP